MDMGSFDLLIVRFILFFFFFALLPFDPLCFFGFAICTYWGGRTSGGAEVPPVLEAHTSTRGAAWLNKI